MAENFFKKPFFLWALAVIITLSSVIYQRLTGPTHPVRGSVQIGEEKISYKLLRNHETVADARMEIDIKDSDISGQIRFKRFKSEDPWTTLPLDRNNGKLIISVPKQPSAGKVIYQVSLSGSDGNTVNLTAEPIIIRFKDPVPAFILYPHVILMFAAMLLATRTGLDALAGGRRVYNYAVITSVSFFIGGLILGPVVQKFAFGALWTGWPFGHDLTDNKTAVAMIFWIIALWRGRGQKNARGWYIVAAVATLIVYLIPHSVLGSELDYTKMD